MKADAAKRAFQLVFIGLVFACTSAVAQDQGAPQQPRAGSPVAQTTVRGCLQPGGAQVTLTDATGTTFLLQGSLGQASQARQYVEVSGQQLSPTSNEGQAAMPRIEVRNLRKLADTCPVNLTPPPSTPNYKATAPQKSPTTPQYDRPATAPVPEGAPVINTQGAGGAPSPGTGNPPPQQQK
jgi:hypothetical protein